MEIKILKHLRSDWFRYGFETIAVVVGILLAFALENWNDERKTSSKSRVYTDKLIQDLVADTNKINELIDMSARMQADINDYFYYFNQGNFDLPEIIDSALNVDRFLFRYLPINYTFLDMQSSGNLNMLNEDQRISLIELSNRQEYLQIIIEKIITDIKREEHERDKFLDSDRSTNDFFESISIKQPQHDLVQGLKHQHNLLTRYNQLASQMISKGNSIKAGSMNSIDFLRNANQTQYGERGSIIGKWALEKVYEYDKDVTYIHNPQGDRWIEFLGNGTFISDGSPYGRNTGRWDFDPVQSILSLDSDLEGDDSRWTIELKEGRMIQTGIGHPRQENTRLIMVRN